MTLDVLHFIDSKGGNAKEIRESQEKRGESVELVDQIIEMYTNWTKSGSCFLGSISRIPILTHVIIVEFDVNTTNREINAIQKQIGQKKKVRDGYASRNPAKGVSTG